MATAFKFMCHFSYLAFALNRISMLGKDHVKLVVFISKVNFKGYIVVTLFISLGFSVIKFFKYKINYDQFETSFPILLEQDILMDSYLSYSNDAYFIINSILDILNYVIFVFICFIIDVWMVIRLRRTLDEKAKGLRKLSSLSSSALEKKKKEFDEAVEKATRMVVLNTAIGIVLKMPSTILPLINLHAEFNFKSLMDRYEKPAFREFYSLLFETEFYGAIQDFSNLLFLISIMLQFFIYKKFDKQFQIAFEQVFHKNKKNSS